MKWSRKLYFILGIFSFVSLEATANTPGNNAADPHPGVEENGAFREDSLVLPEKISLLQDKKKNIPSATRAVSGDVSLLSFNFIYYVIYKFMYIEDIFGLNAPAGKRSTSQ